MWIPEPKIYDKIYNENTMKDYAQKIGKNLLGNRCSVKRCQTNSRLEIHHKNGNRWDNRITNLYRTCCIHHKIFHPSWNKGLTKNTSKKVRLNGLHLSKSLQKNPRILSAWQLYVLRTNMLGRHHSDSTKRIISKKTKSYWSNPVIREARCRAMKQAWIQRRRGDSLSY